MNIYQYLILVEIKIGNLVADLVKFERDLSGTPVADQELELEKLLKSIEFKAGNIIKELMKIKAEETKKMENGINIVKKVPYSHKFAAKHRYIDSHRNNIDKIDKKKLYLINLLKKHIDAIYSKTYKNRPARSIKTLSDAIDNVNEYQEKISKLRTMQLDKKIGHQFEQYRLANYSPDFFSILSAFIQISIVICQLSLKGREKKLSRVEKLQRLIKKKQGGTKMKYDEEEKR